MTLCPTIKQYKQIEYSYKEYRVCYDKKTHDLFITDV